MRRNLRVYGGFWQTCLKRSVLGSFCPASRIIIVIGTGILFQAGLLLGERRWGSSFDPHFRQIAILFIASLTVSWGFVIGWGLLTAPARLYRELQSRFSELDP